MSEVITPDVDEFARTQLAVLDRVGAVTVTSDTEAQAAHDILSMMRRAAQALEEKRVYLKAPHLEGCRRIDEFFNGSIERLRAGTKALKLKIDDFLEQQRKIAEEAAARQRAIQQAERDKLEREARAKEEAAAKARAEAEAKAKAQRDEAARLEAERKIAEDAGRAAEAAKLAGDAAKAAQRAAGITEAGEARAAALTAQADTKRETAAAVPSAVATRVAAPKGFSTRRVYGYKVIDLKKLIKGVAEGRYPVTFLTIDDAVVKRYASAVKDGFDVDGLELTIDKV